MIFSREIINNSYGKKLRFNKGVNNKNLVYLVNKA